MYGVHKTTIYLPDDLRERVKRAAAERQISEAEVIRAAIAQFTSEEPPRPRLPLFSSGSGDLAERVDELLAEGFGRD
jgi:hypothetical protein